MDLAFQNKNVLVTGASGGIGQSIARTFSDEQANVIAHYHSNSQSANQLVSELKKPAWALPANLCDEAQVTNLFSQADAKAGPVHVLVANAGIWPPDHTPIQEMSVEQWQNTIDTNLKSVFLCCREFIRQVERHQISDPAIVMIGSTAGEFGEAGHADYAATKSAMIKGMTLSLKNEIVRVAARGRVNTVSPGWVMTPMAEKFASDPQAINWALSTIALRKVASPQDIANAVVFLSSSQVAGHITGQTITVSGGMEGRRLFREDELS